VHGFGKLALRDPSTRELLAPYLSADANTDGVDSSRIDSVTGVDS
jgi:hypothetical protein